MESPSVAPENEFIWEDLRQAVREQYGNDIISPGKPSNKQSHREKMGGPLAPKLIQEMRKPLNVLNQNISAVNQYPLVHQQQQPAKNSTSGTFRLRISDGTSHTVTPAASAAM